MTYPIENLYTRLPISDYLGPRLYLAKSSKYGATKLKTPPAVKTPRSREPLEYRDQT